jgi:hypothetical protein
MSSSPTGSHEGEPRGARRLESFLKRHERFVPWLILLAVAGGTLAVLQVLVMKLLR